MLEKIMAPMYIETMIIRCPHCEHTRSIPESKIPPTAALATCPKCKNRFRFRAVRPVTEPESSELPAAPALGKPKKPPRLPEIGAEISPRLQALRAETPPRPLVAPSCPAKIPTQETVQPQNESPQALPPLPQESTLQESADHDCIWDAVDALHQRLDDPAPQIQPETTPEQEQASSTPAEAAAPKQPDGIFPYFDGGQNPEERVDQDMRMLRDTRSECPLRDLGAMRELSEAQGAEQPGAQDPLSQGGPAHTDHANYTEDNAIPWENPARNGWLRGFITTLHGVMFRGPEFFSGFSASGSLTPGYLFFLIMGYVTIIGSLLWAQAVAVLLPDMVPSVMGRASVPVLLLLAPIALGLMLLFVTGCIRIALRILAPEQADFIVIYKVVSYAVAPFILSVAPFVGPPLGAIWFLVALIIGCKNALGLSWTLAVLVPLPPAIMLLFGLARAFL